MNINRNIAINASEVIANQSIQIERNNQLVLNLTTDEWGNATFTAENPGDYLIKAGMDESKAFAETITGNPLILNHSLSYNIYPNPFHEMVQIDSTFPIQSVEVFNAEGKCIFRKNNPKSEVDLSGICSGIYVIRVKTEKQVFQQKIIKN